MGEMKPTKGEWEAWTGAAKFGVTGPAAAAAMVAVSAIRSAGFGAHVELASSSQECPGIALGDTRERATSNARLIAEAGTVFHNTGLSPVQLVEQRDELMAMLNGVLQMGRGSSGRIIIEGWQEEVLRAALAKCEGVGNG